MPTIKISKRTVATIAAPEKPVTYYDDILRGFGLIVRPGGSRSWIVEFRPGAGGRGVAKRRLVIGDAASMTPDEARAVAKGMLARVNLGADPAAERSEARAALTVKEVAEKWLAEHVVPKRKPATVKSYRGILSTHLLPAMGGKRAVSITRQDMSRLHSSIAGKALITSKAAMSPRPARGARGGPIIANRTLTIAKAMWAWALGLELLPAGSINPASGVESFREKGRERYLSSEEMSRLGDALILAGKDGLPWVVDESRANAKHIPKEVNRRTVYDPHSIAAIRLMLLTGARVQEILRLEWDQVDFERGMLNLPDSKTGRKTIVLGAASLDVLDSLPRLGRYVIASSSAGMANECPRADINRLWNAIRTAAGLKGFRLHDLRHTNASVGAGQGLSLHMIGQLLGHSQPSTTKRYAHLAAAPQRRAADLIGGQVAEALGLHGNVISIADLSRGSRLKVK